MENIIDFNQKKKEKKNHEQYANGFWYQNTYNALGSNWLIGVLGSLNLKPQYRLANFSANAGWYEHDAFKVSDKMPQFYLADLYGGELKDELRPEEEGFKYLKGNIKAQDVNLKMIDNKPLDVILDIKGALWYALNLKTGSFNDLIKLLNTYYKLLNKNGVLIIDWCDSKNWKWQNVPYHFKGTRKKLVNQKYFGEPSTKVLLSKCLNLNVNKHYQNLFNLIDKKAMKNYTFDKEYNINHPLATEMSATTLNRKEILAIINYLKENKDIIEKKYEIMAYKQVGKWPLAILLWIVVVIISIAFGVKIL